MTTPTLSRMAARVAERAAAPRSWVLTVPKTVSWDAYMEEVESVKDGSLVMNYRAGQIPKDMCAGDRCYVVHDGQVRGWMSVVGLVVRDAPWRCTTTGRVWPAGKYVQRSGPYHAVSGVPMPGFRGIRRYEP